jgi:hypothetical protein
MAVKLNQKYINEVSSYHTFLTIVKDGIASKELCELQRPPGYVGIVFTAGKTLVKAFEDKVDDIAQLLNE